MNGNETWMTANLTCLALGIGHATAPGIPLTDAALWFAPFVGTLVGFASWQYLVSRVSGASEEEDAEVEEIQPGKVMPSARESKVLFLKDTVAAVTDPLSGKVYIHKNICAPTLAMFFKDGWKYGYNLRKMQGVILNDGKQTVVTQGLWAKLTDVLNEHNLIVKVRRSPITSLYQPAAGLRFIRPSPMLSNFTGWWG